jgi:hypothetical protein
MLKRRIKGQLRYIKIHKVIKGSLVWLKRVCGKSGCHCYQGKKHVSLYLSRSVKGRTTMAYIPHRYEDAVKDAVSEYKRILKVLDELSEANLGAIKKRGSI